MASHFLPPAAVTARAAASEPPSTPPICPCCAEQGWRADPATAAGRKSTDTSSCSTRTGILACGGKPDKTGFVKSMEHPSRHTDLLISTKPPLRHHFAPFCSLLIYPLAGGVEQLKNLQLMLLQLVKLVSLTVFSYGREVMASHWPSLKKIPLHLKTKVIKYRQHTLLHPCFLLYTSSIFLVSTTYTDVLQIEVLQELEDSAAGLTTGSASRNHTPVSTLPTLRRPA